jgi:hypothetical protein
MTNLTCPYLSGLNVIAGTSLNWDCLSPLRYSLYSRRQKQENPKCNCEDYSKCKWQQLETKRNQDAAQLELAVLG